MKKIELIQVGNPILRIRSRNVTKPNSRRIQTLIAHLVRVMRAHDLVGISAPQIGISERVCVSEIRKTRVRQNVKQDALRVFINPQIIDASKQKKPLYEGCGSVLNGALFAQVHRHTWIMLRYSDVKGIQKTEKITGLLCQIIQHEVDHLNGILFLDKVTDTRSYVTRDVLRKKQHAV